MAVRAPTFSGLRGAKTGDGILDGEIIAEIAASIGRCGRALERALAELKAHDEAQVEMHDRAPDDDARMVLVQQAADRAWALFIQYELAGISTQKQLVKRYGIPGDVLVRVGIR